MLSEQLVQELRKLNRAEKLRAEKLLVNDLAAAGELMKLLEEDKKPPSTINSETYRTT